MCASRGCPGIGLSWWPGSHCPRCGAPIRPWDNLPLVSFLLLGGRCRRCRQRISWRYPLVEAGLALLFLRVVTLPLASATAARLAVLCFLLLGLLVMDAETYRLQDAFTLPGTALGILQTGTPGAALAPTLNLLTTAPFPAPHWPAWLGSLAGAAGAAAIFFAIRWTYWLVRRQEGIGLGDIKLAAMLGAWMGLAGAALTLALAVLLAAVAGLAMLAIQRGPAAQLRLPLGSFLCGAGLLTLFRGQDILTWYFHFWR